MVDLILILKCEDESYMYIDILDDTMKSEMLNSFEELYTYIISKACPGCGYKVIHSSLIIIGDGTTRRVETLTGDFYNGIEIDEILKTVKEMFKHE